MKAVEVGVVRVDQSIFLNIIIVIWESWRLCIKSQIDADLGRCCSRILGRLRELVNIALDRSDFSFSAGALALDEIA